MYFKTISQNVQGAKGKYDFGNFNFFEDQDIWGQENSQFVKLGHKNVDVIQISKSLATNI